MLHLGVITLFPEMFSPLQLGVVGRAISQQLAKIDYWNPRDFSSKSSRQVDDKPYGGGPGMVMMYKPVDAAISAAKAAMTADTKVIYLSPQGIRVDQQQLNQIAMTKQPLLFLAGRYEGLDERVISKHVDQEWSIGDFVLSGGELATMAFIDAIIRLLPGSLGDHQSAQQDSFMNGLLDYPHFTRPAMIDNQSVPEVLLNGNHRAIERWRRKQSLGKTWLKRPDLLNQLTLNELDIELLIEFKHEHNQL
ncbi:MAG: tRNA (guanosine(37)-N1)-methyltransferase TrmD [Legionella sp.]